MDGNQNIHFIIPYATIYECSNVLILTCPSANQQFRQSWFFCKRKSSLTTAPNFAKQRVDVHTTKRFRFCIFSEKFRIVTIY